MGFSLSPVVVDLFMEHFEHVLLERGPLKPSMKTEPMLTTILTKIH